MWHAATHTWLCYVVLCDRCSTLSSASARSLLHYTRDVQMFPWSHGVPQTCLTYICRGFPIYIHLGRAMAQAVGRRTLTEEAQVRYQGILCDISGAKSGTVTSFSPSTSFFPPCHCHSTISPLIFIYMLLLPDGKWTSMGTFNKADFASVYCSLSPLDFLQRKIPCTIPHAHDACYMPFQVINRPTR
jgi:hypothetical protein